MRRFALTFAAVAAAGPALAHVGVHGGAEVGHAFTFATGLSHPLGGLDHLLAMALVGVWAAAFGAGRQVWLWPATFVGALTLGAAFGHAGLVAPGVETMIALSVVALGLLVALRLPASLALGVAVLAPLGFAHGLAHGAEAPAGSFLAYAAGFVLASAALHAAGVLVGRHAVRASRWLGAAAALVGVWLAVA
jgi:urease accessory protein